MVVSDRSNPEYIELFLMRYNSLHYNVPFIDKIAISQLFLLYLRGKVFDRYPKKNLKQDKIV